jgi:rhodanese-related sulfurtransferase
LKARLAETERLVVLDVRHSLELKYRPSTIPRTMHIPLHELKKRAAEIPAEYEVVAFCDCPKEQAAVAAVQLLRERGHASAVPLLGGLQSWIKYVVNE